MMPISCMSGKTQVDHSGEMAYQFQLLPDKSVGQTVGYGIGIAGAFIRQLPKTRSKQCRSCTTGNNGPGGRS
jgi:hypothetical protein